MLTDGFVPTHMQRNVRPTVLQSWKRSVMSGSDPDRPSLVYSGEVRGHAALRIAADPVLSGLADRLSGLDAGVLLADHDANIVRRWVAANSSIRRLLDQINSDAGFNVSEETVGTNGVGSVIEHGSALQISGPEHLATALAPFTCVGVPIHNPVTRRLEGIVTLSCRATSGNPLLTPLMTSTAQEIESRMLERATVVERQLLDEYMVAIGSRRAPIAAIGHDIFIAGPKVTDLLEGIDRALLWEFVREAATGGRRDSEDWGLAPERFRIARCQPIEREGTVIGALVEFEVTRSETREKDFGPTGSTRSTVALPGKSAAFAQTVSHATRLAARGASILIEGESGVGKSALARAILTSAEVDEDKISTIDCSATDVDGAANFVSVLRHELGLRPDAIVIRHLESLSAESAASAASIVEEFSTGEWRPRVVATLTVSPDDPPSVQGQLRRFIDTVAVGRVVLSPLRNRREDIAPAAAALLNKHRSGRTMSLSSAALRCLMRAPWPGNLRQLDATIRGLVSTTIGSEIRPDDLPLELQSHARKRNLSPMEELELTAILDALNRHHGNKVAAAQDIGISRSTLYRKLQSYRIDPDKQYY
jgi:transcriptional regulator of acetoin/glycerol metabolism